VNIDDMKHLLAILILTLVLAISVHSYMLEARDGSDGGEPGGDHEGEGGQEGCEIIVATVRYFTGATCDSFVFVDNVGLCEGEDYIPLGHCTTVADPNVAVSSIHVIQYTTEFFQCTIYSDNECKNVIATTTSGGGCAGGTDEIESIRCFDPDHD
jgi:hypothetical protein